MRAWAAYPGRMWALTLLATLAAGSAKAAELSATAIVSRTVAHHAFGFDGARVHLRLTLARQRGARTSRRTREISVSTIRHEGRSKSLVRFTSPADIAGTGFLILANADAPDQQYLFLPALGKSKRIGGSQRHQRFMGTDLTYGDLESRSLRSSASRRLADGVVGGHPTYVIEATAVDAKTSGYGKTISWIDKNSFIPLRVQFFDERLRPLKTMEVVVFEQRQGRWVVMDSVIKNSQSNSQTRMQVTAIDLEPQFTADFFSKRALEQP